ncbi:MAG TPA: hypothetical protein VF209_03035 [Patescibacteria group bacterium]
MTSPENPDREPSELSEEDKLNLYDFVNQGVAHILAEQILEESPDIGVDDLLARVKERYAHFDLGQPTATDLQSARDYYVVFQAAKGLKP